MRSPGRFGRTLIRLYLMAATGGGILALPFLAFWAWYMAAWTKDQWPGNWPGWVAYVLFSAAMVLGPFVGWALFRRGRPYAALAVGALAFALLPLIGLGLLLG